MLVRAGAAVGRDDRLQVDQVLVDADLEHSADLIAGLVGAILVDAAGAEATEAHLPRRLGDQFVGHLAAAAQVKYWSTSSVTPV